MECNKKPGITRVHKNDFTTSNKIQPLINNNLIAADIRCTYNGHPFKLVIDILIEVVMVIQIFPQVKFGIDKQVMGFFAEICEIVFNKFVNRTVECILIHRVDVLCSELPHFKSMPTVAIDCFMKKLLAIG
jgi:hypothetical protein